MNMISLSEGFSWTVMALISSTLHFRKLESTVLSSLLGQMSAFRRNTRMRKRSKHTL
jgi:hypothetical protein